MVFISRGVGFLIVGTCAAIGAGSIIAKIAKWKIGHDMWMKSQQGENVTEMRRAA